MKVIITDCDHDSIDIEKKVFADAGMEVELKQAITEDEVIACFRTRRYLLYSMQRLQRK